MNDLVNNEIKFVIWSNSFNNCLWTIDEYS
jgi:hypothetical protein